MNPITILETTRQNVLSLADNYSHLQLNHIPKGYTNNLIWNMGHILVTQQLLCYRCASLQTYLPEVLIEQFRKGTAPNGNATQETIEQIKQRLQETISRLKEDVDQQRFTHYQPYQTSYGVQLHSFEDALVFNNVHEGMHLGYMLALCKNIPN